MKATTKEVAKAILDELWEQFLRRVSYAKIYTSLVLEKGGKVVNDHIAIRTLNTHTGEQPEGIRAMSHIFKCLDYKSMGSYKFQKKKLNAIHLEHVDMGLPKIFVSQLEVSELPEWAQSLIKENVKDTPYLLSDHAIELLMRLSKDGCLTEEAAEILVYEIAGYFRRPWKIPSKEAILKLNDVSQYAAWVLLHGNSINHFTALINKQGVKEWPDIQSTCKALEEAGVPMKERIEGKEGSILRQSSTQAVKEMVEVINDDGEVGQIIWTYAYYELAERGFIEENGEKKLFQGFLGEQASHLFDITRTRDN